jgi:hypothetical protein
VRTLRLGYARLSRDLRDWEQEHPGVALSEWLGGGHDFDTEEEHLGVIVSENAFASLPLPRRLFCVTYNERYGLGDEIRLARLFAGEGVLKYEALMGERIRGSSKQSV